MTAIEKGIITESTKTRLTELEDEKRNVEIEIAKESIARRIISREQIIYWISSFKDGDITSEKYRQQLIDTFVHAVFVYDDKIVITYNYSGENNTATISDLDLSSPPKIRPSAKGRWPYFWASPARRAGTNLLDGVQEVLPGVVHGVTHVLHGAAHAGLHGPLPG